MSADVTDLRMSCTEDQENQTMSVPISVGKTTNLDPRQRGSGVQKEYNGGPVRESVHEYSMQGLPASGEG